MIRLYAMPGNETFASGLAQPIGAETGRFDLHRFPDGECLIRVRDDPAGKRVAIVCTLRDPDPLFLPLVFTAGALREAGAVEVGLVAPYLAYMRQDKSFHPGESVTSRLFATALSSHFNWLVTVDPHLHRYRSLSEIYPIPAQAAHAAPGLAAWIADAVPSAVLIGPDGESEQWVKDVADRAGVPYEVLLKTRHGDADVEVTLPHPERWKRHVPVLLDDIISTGRTMMAAVKHLREAGLPGPLCVGVHGVFAPGALAGLKQAGARDVVTTNTIPGVTARIDVTAPVATELQLLIGEHAEPHLRYLSTP